MKFADGNISLCTELCVRWQAAVPWGGVTDREDKHPQ